MGCAAGGHSFPTDATATAWSCEYPSWKDLRRSTLALEAESLTHDGSMGRTVYLPIFTLNLGYMQVNIPCMDPMGNVWLGGGFNYLSFIFIPKPKETSQFSQVIFFQMGGSTTWMSIFAYQNGKLQVFFFESEVWIGIFRETCSCVKLPPGVGSWYCEVQGISPIRLGRLRTVKRSTWSWTEKIRNKSETIRNSWVPTPQSESWELVSFLLFGSPRSC